MAKQNNVDWERYHSLLDIGMRRKYTATEQAEYDTYLPVLAKLDAEEAAIAKPTHDRLVRRHEETLASLDKLISGLRKV